VKAVGALAAMLRKDFRLELRSGRSTVALVALSLLVLVVLVFALDAAGARRADAAAGALWVAMVMAGMLGATRVLTSEAENGCLRALALSPIDPAALYGEKLIAAFIFMAVAELAAIVLVVLFFNLEFNLALLRVLPILLLGALGFGALATLLALIAHRVRAGDLLLPILTVPLFVPALVAGVKASSAVLGAATAGVPLRQWVGILAAFDVLFVAAGYLLFEHVLGED
jgi:heme exporter protein B